MLSLHFTPFPTLTTNRFVLRELTQNDAKEIFELRTDAQVNKFLDRDMAKSIDDAKKFIHTIQTNVQTNSAILWAIAFNDRPGLLGTICYWNISTENDTAEIGYEMLPNFQGMGIMQEVFPEVIRYGFEKMKLRSIEAYTLSENERSTRLLEKNSFILNGKLEPESNDFGMTLIYFLQNKTKQPS